VFLNFEANVVIHNHRLKQNTDKRKPYTQWGSEARQALVTGPCLCGAYNG